MHELKSLTLNGKTYDSFPDKKAVKTINGKTPDENGNVNVASSSGSLEQDLTLIHAGLKSADGSYANVDDIHVLCTETYINVNNFSSIQRVTDVHALAAIDVGMAMYDINKKFLQKIDIPTDPTKPDCAFIRLSAWKQDKTELTEAEFYECINIKWLDRDALLAEIEPLKAEMNAFTLKVEQQLNDNAFSSAPVINDGLNQTCASAAEVHYDENRGLVYVTYLSSKTKYGEQRDLVMLSIFPLTQPINAKHVVVAENGVDGVKPFEPNIFATDDNVLIYFRLEDGGYYYKTYEKATGLLSSEKYPMRFNNGMETVDMTDANIGAFVTSKSGTVGSYYIFTCRITKHNDIYYSVISTLNGSAFVVTSSDGIIWTAAGIIPGTCQYEVQIGFIDETMVLSVRGDDGLYSSTDYGVTFNKTGNQTTNRTRPQLFEYDGKILSVFGYGTEPENKAPATRQRIRIKLGTNPVVYRNDLVMELYSEYGIVYPAVFSAGTELYMIYSDSKRFWYKNTQAKDELRLMHLGDFSE